MGGYKKASQWLTKYSSNVSRLGMSTKRIVNVIKTFESVQNLQNNLRYSISNGREEDKKSVILSNTAASSAEPLTREPGESIEDFAKRVTERNERNSKEARFKQDMQSEDGQQTDARV